jgi:hypothetical protein
MSNSNGDFFAGNVPGRQRQQPVDCGSVGRMRRKITRLAQPERGHRRIIMAGKLAHLATFDGEDLRRRRIGSPGHRQVVELLVLRRGETGSIDQPPDAPVPH